MTTVLLVDDEANVLRGLTRYLHGQPYNIYTARSAEEAISIFKARPVDLVVSDEHMAGIRGTEFLAWVANNYPQVPRIMLTGDPTAPAAMRAINKAKVYKFFCKPCDILELAFSIREALEQ